MARGIHGLPKFSPGSAMPDPSTPCGRATPQTALQLFLGWPTHRAGGLRPSSSPLDTPCRMGLVGGNILDEVRMARGSHELPKGSASARHALPLYALRVVSDGGHP
jgi:hypothetical protein